MRRGPEDNVFLMMSEMNKEKFEGSWALPQLDRLWEVTKDIDPAANPVAFYKAVFGCNKV
jgi:hypothetical protein